MLFQSEKMADKAEGWRTWIFVSVQCFRLLDVLASLLMQTWWKQIESRVNSIGDEVLGVVFFYCSWQHYYLFLEHWNRWLCVWLEATAITGAETDLLMKCLLVKTTEFTVRVTQKRVSLLLYSSRLEISSFSALFYLLSLHFLLL